MLGYFERIPSERQIAWRVADSLSLRRFVGYSLTTPTPDHSTISKTRRRLPLSVHTAVFTKVLEILVTEKLLRGKRIGVGATTLQANAGIRALTHNISGKSYREYVKSLMAEDANEPENPGPEDISRFDRRRKGKKLSNKHWHNPRNRQAKTTKMKGGRENAASRRPSMPTATTSEAMPARAGCASGGSWWSGPSPTIWMTVGCAGSGSKGTGTSPSGCWCMWPGSTTGF
jgi:hypothetical protein